MIRPRLFLAPLLFKEGKLELGPPSFQPQKPTRARAGSLPFLPRNLLLPGRENASFLPRFGCLDFWFEFAVKRWGTHVSLRNIATYSSKEQILASKSSL
jgi:hypothetical protein